MTTATAAAAAAATGVIVDTNDIRNSSLSLATTRWTRFVNASRSTSGNVTVTSSYAASSEPTSLSTTARDLASSGSGVDGTSSVSTVEDLVTSAGDLLEAATRWLLETTGSSLTTDAGTTSTAIDDVTTSRRNFSSATDLSGIILNRTANLSAFDNHTTTTTPLWDGEALSSATPGGQFDAMTSLHAALYELLSATADAYDIENGSALFAGGNSTQPMRGPVIPMLRHENVAYTFLTCIVLGLMILATIIGNAFVIAAIVLERNLHSVANYLIASLAVADLMVAGLVMPLAAVNEVSAEWFLGVEACDAFISFDVLCCTASILHLVAISVDRYWAVTRVDYIHNRPVGRIVAMIALSWGISTVISIPPLFGWKSPDNDPALTGVCLISQDWGYTVYSTLGAFYIPLAFMIAIYMNVYRAARLRIRKRQFRQRHAIDADQSTWMSSVNADRGPAGGNGAGRSETASTPQLSLDTPTTPSLLLPPDICDLPTPPPLDTPSTVTSPMLPSPPASPLTLDGSNGSAAPWSTHRQSPTTCGIRPLEMTSSQRLSTERRAKKKREQNRERKAARTLGIVTGSFVICWLPFFILALVRPFCGDRCHYPTLLVSVIGWLGYFNSLLNPIIYTIFNPDFRSAFRKILFGKYRGHSAARSAAAVASGVNGRRTAVSVNGGSASTRAPSSRCYNRS